MRQSDSGQGNPHLDQPAKKSARRVNATGVTLKDIIVQVVEIAEHVAQIYPDRAQRLGKSGQVVVDCEVRFDGTMPGRFIKSETPEEFGFGDAALKITRFFK